MHHNQPGIFKNNLSSHASLLLSASPTIVTSSLQNNSKNARNSPLHSPAPVIRRQTSAPLLPADNLDPDSQVVSNNSSNSTPAEGFINFKKPQSEIFKKIDGKIQRIVAAHSNLNKLYALNDFPGLGSGTKRPFELPPQLPPPPPWVPKGTQDNQNHWSEDSDNKHLKPSSPLTVDLSRAPLNQQRACSSTSSKTMSLDSANSSQSPNLLIDSAITKLHHRRQQQEQGHLQAPGNQQLLQRRRQQFLSKSTTEPSQASSTAPSEILTSTPKPQLNNINPTTFALVAQKIKEALETETTKTQNGSLTSEDKKKFQENLINLLKKEISAVAKSANLSFTSPPKVSLKPINSQRSLLLKSSPRTIFNTIRRETSLLLSQRNIGNRSSLSILPSQNDNSTSVNYENSASRQLVFNKLQNTIKVVMPPSEYHPDNVRKMDSVGSPRKSSNIKSELSYQIIRNKIKSFQEANRVHLGQSQRITLSPTNFYSIAKMKTCSQKSLDKIVDRLQARCSTSQVDQTMSSEPEKKPSFHEQILNTSASLLRSSQMSSSISLPTPIPVFRSPLIPSSKNGYMGSMSSSAALKAMSVRLKKNKKTHNLGLKISSYIDKESPQASMDTMTVEDYARGLNLVRTNDVSLQRYREKLLQSESKWKMPIGNRPLRLRRIRGERIHMPASASYKAASKVGLQ